MSVLLYNIIGSVVLLGTIAFKIWQIYRFKKKETWAVLTGVDGLPKGVYCLRSEDFRRRFFKIKKDSYVIHTPQFVLFHKKLLFYVEGVSKPLDFPPLADRKALGSEEFKTILDNELAKEMARLQNPLLQNLPWKYILLVVGGAVLAYIFFSGGGVS